MADLSLFPESAPVGVQPFETGAAARAPVLGSSMFPDDPQTTRLRSAVDEAQGKSPETAARVLRLQTKTGLPADLIERDLDGVERQASRADFDAEKFRRESPALAAWLAANPKHAEVAQGDMANLSMLDRLLNAATRGSYSLSQSGSGLAMGANARAMREADALDARLSAGEQPGAIADSQDAAGYRWMSPVQRATYRSTLGGSISGSVTNIVKRQGQIEALPPDPTIAAALQSKSFADFWFHFSQKPVEFILTVGAESLPAMAPAVGLGIAGGGIGGLPLAAAGMGAGSFGVDYAASTLDALRDEGVDLKDRDSIAAAIADKDLMARVGRKAFSHAAPVAAFDGASGSLAGLRLVPARQVAGVVAKKSIAGSAAHGAAELTAQGVVQGAAGATGEALGQVAQGNTQLDAGQIMAEFFGEFATAPVEVGTMTVSGARQAGREKLRAAERTAFFEALGQGVSDSATFQRMPEKLREFIASATRDGPVENVYVPVEAWQTYWQSQNVDPREAAAEVMGGTTLYEEAMRTGVDIAVPLADYATKIAPNAQANAAFMEEIRLRPDEMNSREAAEIEKALAEQAQAGAETGATPADKVREDVTGQLIGAGFDRSTVDAYASMYERAFGTMGQRAGVDPFELYQRYGLRIARPLPDVLKPAGKIDALDALIDRVRSGSGKTQEEMFGPSLTEFLRASGGVKDMQGELKGRDADKNLKPFQRKLVKDDGLAIDKAIEAAQQAGYFPAGEVDLSEFLNAIDDDLRGNKRYASTSLGDGKMQSNDAVLALAQHLDSLGLDVRALSNEEIKKALDEASANQGNTDDVTFEQIDPRTGNLDADASKRGAIRFGADRQFSIDIFEHADLSTVLHESGHFYLEVFGDVVNEIRQADAATLTDTQRQMLTDYDAALKWLGVTSRAEIGVDQHEQWARGIEAYFREGKAPSADLRSIFAKFRSWLVNVYRSLSQLRVNLSPEVSAVMDRIFATDQEIEAAEREAEILPLFVDAKQAGMTDEEFAAYRRTVQSAGERARETLQAKLLAQLQRQREAWWKEERVTVQAEVAGEVYQRPEYIALSVLQRGTMPDGSPLPEGIAAVKLDRKALADVYGAEFLKRLPRPYVYAKEGGVAPDLAADLFGFQSGDELVMAIANAKPMRPLIEAETEARMRERHGDMMLDGTLADAARAAVQNDERSQVIEAEMRALRRKQREVAPFVRQERERAIREAAYAQRWADAERALAVAIQKGVDQVEIEKLTEELRALKARSRQGAAMLNAGLPSLESIRAMARGRVAQSMVRELRPMVYLIAARKASKAATRTAATDDFNEALLQKQRELMNVELYRAATLAQEQVDSAVDYMRSFDGAKKRQRIAKAGGDYLDQIDGILDKFEFKRVALKILERRKSVAAWAAEKEKAGLPVNLPPMVLEDAGRRNYKEMTVEELSGLRDAVRHIEHLATLKNKLLKAKAKRELDEVVGDLDAAIRGNAKKQTRKIETRLPSDEAARFVAGWFASHRKLASLTREMDGFEDGGVVWEYVMRPLNDAANAETGMKEAATIKLGELFDVYRGKDASALYHKTHIPAIGASLTKMGRLMVALNWGNEGNRQRVMDGYGWNETQAKAILDTLDERDWKFVQGVWDHIDSYWPEIAAKQKRVEGIAPDKVERSKVVTKFGEIDGGYFPIKYDDRQSGQAGAHLESEFADISKAASYVRASTRRGHTQARAEKVEMPIRLDFGVIFEHVNQVIHDLTHHEMLLDAGRLLGHKTVQAAIYDTYGDQVYREIKSVLVDVALGDTPAGNAWEKSMSYLRQGTTVAYLGWNLMTSLQQPLGLFNSMQRVGVKWVAKGMSRWLRSAGSMENSVAWIHDRSEFMRLRHKTQQREISEIRDRLGVQSGRLSGWIDEALRTTSFDTVTKQGITDSYFWMIAKAQMIADVPTWLGAYEKHMAGGEPEERAIALADQAVLDSQGGGQVKDLASVQRGGPMLKLWTNFYSVFNVIWNQNVEATRRTNFRDPVSIGRLAVSYLIIDILPATLSALLKEALTGNGDDDLWKRLAKENLSYAAGLMVGVREIAQSALGFTGYQGPAGARFFVEAGAFAKQAWQGELDDAFWKHFGAMRGILFHYPSAQIQRTVDGFKALRDGQTRNPLALVFGPRKP